MAGKDCAMFLCIKWGKKDKKGRRRKKKLLVGQKKTMAYKAYDAGFVIGEMIAWLYVSFI